MDEAGAKLADRVREARSRDPLWQQKRRERAIAAPYMGRVEWLLVLEAAVYVGGWLAMGALALAGAVPYGLAMLVNGVLAYAAYMPLHEATHNNVQGNHPTWRWLNDCVGWAGSLPLMFTFRGHQMSHMRHHAFTNDPKRDPDHFISGSIQELPRKLFELSVGQFAIATLGWRKGFEGRLADLDKGRFSSNPREARLEFHTTRRTFTIQLAFLVASSLAGYFPEVLFLYYLPSRIGLLGIMFTFAWFPHHPAIERGRYRDTRVTLFPGSGILFAGHDRHVVHHMLPRVPHYRIPPLFAALRPMLEERGVRIEGRLAGPGAPPVLLRPDPRIDQIRSQAEV